MDLKRLLELGIPPIFRKALLGKPEEEALELLEKLTEDSGKISFDFVEFVRWISLMNLQITYFLKAGGYKYSIMDDKKIVEDNLDKTRLLDYIKQYKLKNPFFNCKTVVTLWFF